MTLVHPIAKPGQCLRTQCFVLGALLTILLTGCGASNISGADDAYDWESEYEPAATPEVDEDTVDEAWETYEKAHSVDEDVTENAWKAYDVASTGMCRVEAEFPGGFASDVKGSRAEFKYGVVAHVAELVGDEVHMSTLTHATIGVITRTGASVRAPYHVPLASVSGGITKVESPPWREYRAFNCTDTETYLGAIQLEYFIRRLQVIP